MDPWIMIATPTDGSTVSGKVSVAIACLATSGVKSIDLLVDGVKIDSLSSFSHGATFTWHPKSKGPHTLTAVIHDEVGKSQTSDPIHVTVA